MAAIWGQWSIWLGLIPAFLLILSPLLPKKRPLINILAGVHLTLLSIAFIALITSLINDDFSLRYVVNHSSIQLPLMYKISAAWGGHEGSLLLWTLLISLWLCFFVKGANRQPAPYFPLSVTLTTVISLGLQVLLLIASPFEKIQGAMPANGHDLNPMLQDIGLILHPPALYLGYSAFAIVFSLSLAQLCHKQQCINWQRLRSWLLLAWSLLTMGIALGSWWAYTELGWGGWWFWDPVENASLMPWLTMLAMIHIQIIAQHRPEYRKLFCLLAIITMTLILLGGFLVRSGILSSVHAFALEPTAGIVILTFLVIVSGGGFTLFALYAQKCKSPDVSTPYKRHEILLLLFIVTLFAGCGGVLLGTLYPLAFEVFNLGDISVGSPYFNSFFIPLTFCSIALLCGYLYSIRNNITVTYGHWIHAGLLILVVGATITETFDNQRQLPMLPGEITSLSETDVRFEGTTPRREDTYFSDYGFFRILEKSKTVAVINPEKRLYLASGIVLSEAGVSSQFTRDIYITLGEPMQNGSWAVRIQIKPMISLLWIGAAMMILAGLWGALQAYAKKSGDYQGVSNENNGQTEKTQNSIS